MWQIAGIIIGILLLININQWEKNKRLQKDIYDLEASIITYRWKLSLKDTLNNISSNSPVSKETLEAVKYAMQKAHPDNGGNAEQFIKFRKLYESMKG